MRPKKAWSGQPRHATRTLEVAQLFLPHCPANVGLSILPINNRVQILIKSVTIISLMLPFAAVAALSDGTRSCRRCCKNDASWPNAEKRHSRAVPSIKP